MVFEVENADESKMIECPNEGCGKRSWLECKKAYHGESQCVTVTNPRLVAEENATQRVVRRWPSCNVDIQRTDGCDHMVCACGITFCYACNRDITKTHACNEGAVTDRTPVGAPQLAYNSIRQQDETQSRTTAPASTVRYPNANVQQDNVYNPAIPQYVQSPSVQRSIVHPNTVYVRTIGDIPCSVIRVGGNRICKHLCRYTDFKIISNSLLQSLDTYPTD